MGCVCLLLLVDKSGNLIAPTVGLPTRATRDVIRSGGMQNWDMSLFKNIPIRERYSVQLRLEAFNVFNHANFNDKNYRREYQRAVAMDLRHASRRRVKFT